MAKPNPITSVQIMPEHCGGDAFGWATEMRAACDAFFRRRGLNIYGGTKEVRQGGLRGIVHAGAEQGEARKKKRSETLLARS